MSRPTTSIFPPSNGWKANWRRLRSALVLISHDRRFLQNLSRSTIWLDRGVTRRLERGFGEFEAWRDALLEQEERDAQKLDRKIVSGRTLGALWRNRPAQTQCPQHGANWPLCAQQSRTPRNRSAKSSSRVAEGKISGRLVVEAEKISKAYGERPIVKELSLRVLRGDRLALVGPNGAGKTTLLNLLTGARANRIRAMIRLGTNLQMATLDQGRAALDPDATLADTLTGGGSEWVEINGVTQACHWLYERFPVPAGTGAHADGKLSGGERARLAAGPRACSQPSNFLVLDEPTNDLDLETLDLLQEMLGDYPGTILLVSHDRDFLDRVAGSVLASGGDGVWIEYAGGYTDMIRQRGDEAASDEPRRIAEKKIRRVEPQQSAAGKRRLSFRKTRAGNPPGANRATSLEGDKTSQNSR